MSNTPHLNRIVLNGGPRDGDIVEIDPFVAESGRIRVPYIPLPVTMRAEEDYPANSLLQVHVYRRECHSEGTFNTCEFRVWYEWHYEGEH